MLPLLKMPRPLIGIIASIFMAACCGASTVSLTSMQDWSNGINVGTNPNRVFGQLELASNCGLSGDSFDRSFIKSIWQSDPGAIYAQVTAGLWAIGAGAGGTGLTSAFRPVDGKTI